MVARRRLLRSLQALVFSIALLLCSAAGLPRLLMALGVERPWLAALWFWGRLLLVAAPGLLLIGAVWQGWTLRRRYRRAQGRLETEGITFLLLPRADAPPVKADRVSLWNHVADVLPRDEHVSFEVIGDKEGVRFAARASKGVERALMTQLMAQWPGTQARPVTRAGDDPLVADGRAAWWCELQPRYRDVPLVAVAADPLLAPLTELARLPEGVRAGVQWLVRGDPFTRQHIGRRAARQHAQQDKETPLATRRQTKLLDERAQHQFLEVRLRVWAAGGSERMARSVARSLARAILSQYGPTNPMQQGREGAGLPMQRDFPAFGGRAWADQELGALAHLVGADARSTVPQLRCAPANPLPPSPACCVPKGAHLSPRLRVPRPSRDAATVVRNAGEGVEPLVLVEEGR